MNGWVGERAGRRIDGWMDGGRRHRGTRERSSVLFSHKSGLIAAFSLSGRTARRVWVALDRNQYDVHGSKIYSYSSSCSPIQYLMASALCISSAMKEIKEIECNFQDARVFLTKSNAEVTKMEKSVCDGEDRRLSN